jgi:hypothetical protein
MLQDIPRLLKASASLMLLAASAACAPGGRSVPPEVMETMVAQAAFDLLTQTAAASSPTPPPPTVTPSPMWTDTPQVTPTETEPPPMPRTITYAACWLGGPGPDWALEVNVPNGKGVDMIGVGSVPGWYILRDYKFQRPCWILATDLKIDPRTDLSSLPVMTPGVPGIGE